MQKRCQKANLLYLLAKHARFFKQEYLFFEA